MRCKGCGEVIKGKGSWINQERYCKPCFRLKRFNGKRKGDYRQVSRCIKNQRNAILDTFLPKFELKLEAIPNFSRN